MLFSSPGGAELGHPPKRRDDNPDLPSLGSHAGSGVLGRSRRCCESRDSARGHGHNGSKQVMMKESYFLPCLEGARVLKSQENKVKLLLLFCFFHVVIVQSAENGATVRENHLRVP